MKEACQRILLIGANALVIYVASRCAERPNNFRRMLRQSGAVKRVK